MRLYYSVDYLCRIVNQLCLTMYGNPAPNESTAKYLVIQFSYAHNTLRNMLHETERNIWPRVPENIGFPVRDTTRAGRVKINHRTDATDVGLLKNLLTHQSPTRETKNNDIL